MKWLRVSKRIAGVQIILFNMLIIIIEYDKFAEPSLLFINLLEYHKGESLLLIDIRILKFVIWINWDIYV